MKRKKTVSVFASALLLLSLLLSACGQVPQEPEPAPPPEPVPVTITEYVNTTEAFGNTEHSRIRIGDDGSFVLLDNYSAGTNELTGTWTLEDGIYTLSVETAKMGNYRTILFEMKDGQTLILKTDLTGSKAGQTFSSDPDAEMVSLNSEDDFPYGKYDNTSSVGAFRSYIMIYPKGTFSYADTDNVSTEVISGTYVRSADRLTCSYTSGGSQKTFDLQIRDDGVLVLLNDVGKSGTGNLFSMNANTGDSSKVIPCYGIVFNNHRPNVFDDDPGWNIGAEALPENTTDTMVYSTGDPSVLVIDQQGNITVKGTGSTYVKVVCGEEETMAYVQVAKNGPTSVLFNPGAGRLDLGFGMQLKAIVIPESGSQKVRGSFDRFRFRRRICKRTVPRGDTDLRRRTERGRGLLQSVCERGDCDLGYDGCDDRFRRRGRASGPCVSHRQLRQLVQQGGPPPGDRIPFIQSGYALVQQPAVHVRGIGESEDSCFLLVHLV